MAHRLLAVIFIILIHDKIKYTNLKLLKNGFFLILVVFLQLVC